MISMSERKKGKSPENPQQSNEYEYGFDEGRWGYKLVPDKLVHFLEALSHNGNISMSARMIGMSRSTILKFAQKNPSFRVAMNEAIEEARDFALGELLRRGVRGWDEPVWYRGEEVGTIRKYSDSCLIRYVQAHFPQFRHDQETQVETESLIPDEADLTRLSDEELEQLEYILVKLERSKQG